MNQSNPNPMEVDASPSSDERTASLVKEIFEVLEKKEISKADLAKHLGTSISTIYNMEKSGNMRLDRFMNILALLNAKLDIQWPKRRYRKWKSSAKVESIH